MAMVAFASQSKWGWGGGGEAQATKGHTGWVGDNTTPPNPRIAHYVGQWLPLINALEQGWGPAHAPADTQGARGGVRGRLATQPARSLTPTPVPTHGLGGLRARAQLRQMEPTLLGGSHHLAPMAMHAMLLAPMGGPMQGLLGGLGEPCTQRGLAWGATHAVNLSWQGRAVVHVFHS